MIFSTYLDQSRLPEIAGWKVLEPHQTDVLIEAIQGLEVRGAPLLGLIGAWGALMIRIEHGWTSKAEFMISALAKGSPYCDEFRSRS